MHGGEYGKQHRTRLRRQHFDGTPLDTTPHETSSSAQWKTAKDIATEIGVSAQTVSKYMKHDIFPALDTFAKLCKSVDASSDYILGISKD